MIVLVVSVLADAWPVSSRGVDFLTSNVSSFPDKAGVRQGIIGSLILIVFVALLAVPIGVGGRDLPAGIRARHAANRLLITNIRNLAGVPAIVYGILGVVIFVQAMQSITGPKVHGRSIIAGGLTLSVLVMPFVILITMEALRAVPKSIREAAYGVGATGGRSCGATCCRTRHPGSSPGLSCDRPGVRRDGTAPAGGGGHRIPLDRQRRPRVPPGEIHGAADEDLRVVEAAVERGANTAAAIVVLLGSILVVNFAGHPPEEPV